MLQQRNSADENQQQGDENRREEHKRGSRSHAEPTKGAQSDADPQEDFAEVIRVSRDAPQAGTNPALLVLRDLPKSAFLEVGDDFEGESDDPQRNPDVVQHAEVPFLRRLIKNQDRQNGDEHPHALHRPCHEEPRCRLLDDREAIVDAVAAVDPREQEPAEAGRPDGDEQAQNDLPGGEFAFDEVNAQGERRQVRQTAGQVVILLSPFVAEDAASMDEDDPLNGHRVQRQNVQHVFSLHDDLTGSGEVSDDLRDGDAHDDDEEVDPMLALLLLGHVLWSLCCGVHSTKEVDKISIRKQLNWMYLCNF